MSIWICRWAATFPLCMLILVFEHTELHVIWSEYLSEYFNWIHCIFVFMRIPNNNKCIMFSAFRKYSGPFHFLHFCYVAAWYDNHLNKFWTVVESPVETSQQQ